MSERPKPKATFEVPKYALDYRGEVTARLLLYLFALAHQRSPYFLCAGRISFHLRLDNLARKIHCDAGWLSKALDQLAGQGILERFQDGKQTSKIRLNVNGSRRNVCTANAVPCFNVPRSALPVLYQLTASGLHLYLVLANIIHDLQSKSVTCKRPALRKQTGLSRPSFNSAERECTERRLLRRKDDKWMLLAPAQPKKKKSPSRLTPGQWEDLLVWTLGKEYRADDPKRFLKYDKNRRCPFCSSGTQPRISVIYDGERGSNGFNCFACGNRGRLPDLLRQAIGMPPDEPLKPWLSFHLRQIENYKRIPDPLDDFHRATVHRVPNESVVLDV